MNCKDINELFTAYLDGEVTPDEREQIQAHLSTCPRCREGLELLAATQNSLRQALKVTAAGATPSPQAWVVLRQRLEAGEQPKVTIWGLAKSKVKGGIDIMIRGLVSRQPVWKTAVVSMLAVALVIGLSLTIPSLSTESVYAQATDIAQNSPQVQAALGDEEVQVVKVIKIVDGKGTVICEGTMGRLVTAEVDLESEEVTNVEVAIEIVDMPELSEADEQAAINIAKADPKVQEILDEGASVYNVHPSCSFGMRVSPETGETEEFSEVLAVVVLASGVEEWEGGTVYNPDGEVWFVHVDLAQEKVVRIINPKDFPEAAPSGKFKIESFDVDEEGRMKLHLGKGGIERNTQ